jgi:hypothetical protein
MAAELGCRRASHGRSAAAAARRGRSVQQCAIRDEQRRPVHARRDRALEPTPRSHIRWQRCANGQTVQAGCERGGDAVAFRACAGHGSPGRRRQTLAAVLRENSWRGVRLPMPRGSRRGAAARTHDPLERPAEVFRTCRHQRRQEQHQSDGQACQHLPVVWPRSARVQRPGRLRRARGSRGAARG